MTLMPNAITMIIITEKAKNAVITMTNIMNAVIIMATMAAAAITASKLL